MPKNVKDFFQLVAFGWVCCNCGLDREKWERYQCKSSLVPELAEMLALTMWGVILAVAAKVYNQA